MATVISLGGVFAYFILLLTPTLWGTWRLVGIQADTDEYLEPVAAALFEGHWDHLERPSGYPAFAYIAVRLGGSLNALIAFQLAGYLLTGLLVYLVVLISLSSADRTGARHTAITAPLFAGAATIDYFVLSSSLRASAYYVIPEFVSSAAMVVALTLCAALTLNRTHPGPKAVALAIGATVCAAMLISFKPSLTATALLTLILAAWGLIWQSQVSRSLTVVILVTMMAIPSGATLVDDWLIRKYADAAAIEFGPKTAFCNNATLIDLNLERPGSATAHILGADGSREVAQFLRDVIAAPGGWSLLGFNGDNCMYTLGKRREQLEQKYFGTEPDQVVAMYRRFVLTSILESPGDYLLRIFKQLSAYVTQDPVSCGQYSLFDWKGEMHSLVKHLILLYAVGPTLNQALPTAPGTETLCRLLRPLLSPLHFPVISLGFALAIIQLVRRVRQHLDLTQELAVLQSVAFWLSGALVIALVHTFDIGRYVTVMFPIYIATLAIASGYLTTNALQLFRWFMARPRQETLHVAKAKLVVAPGDSKVN